MIYYNVEVKKQSPGGVLQGKVFLEISQLYQKRSSGTGVFLKILWNFLNFFAQKTFSYRTLPVAASEDKWWRYLFSDCSHVRFEYWIRTFHLQYFKSFFYQIIRRFVIRYILFKLSIAFIAGNVWLLNHETKAYWWVQLQSKTAITLTKLSCMHDD